MDELNDRLSGTLIGTALGDALGLVAEGMSASAIERRFGRLDTFRFFGQTGFVSDDTEQSALVAHALLSGSSDVDLVRRFRWSLLGWFLRLPWGLGLATLRACMKIGLGMKRSGVYSAGNGAAMRAAVVGVYHHSDSRTRRLCGTALATVTHTDPRAVEGALMVGEVAALCAQEDVTADRRRLVERAAAVVQSVELKSAIDRALLLASNEACPREAASELGNTGFIVHTIGLATFVFLRFGRDARQAVVEAVACGGDADSIGAIVGAWVGALHGYQGLPPELVGRLQRGPFGAAHLRGLATALASKSQGGTPMAVSFAWPVAMIRNLLLFPVALVQGIRAAIGV